MRERSTRILGRSSAALAAVALLAGGCRTTEFSAPVPGRTDDMGRTIGPLTPDHGWSYTVESGALRGALPGSSERLAPGLAVAIRADGGLPGTAAAHGVEEYRPAALPVGLVRWPRGAGLPDADVVDDVLVEWMIGLRERGSCAVEIDLVPRLTPACGAPVFLEGHRVRRRVALGEALVVTTVPGAGPGSIAAMLVGAPAGGAGRFVVRVRN